VGAFRSSIAVPSLLGLVVAAASWVVPLSYDEGNWLAVVRRVAGGETLYRDVTDNKSPVLFGLVRALDVLPGPYVTARAALLGIAAVLIAWLASGTFVKAGFEASSARVLGSAIGLAGAMQAVLVLNFEMPAALLIIGGIGLMAARRDIAGGVMAGLAVTFDLRATALLPGVLLIAIIGGDRGRATRAAVSIAVPALAWGVLVLANGELRYSLLELNVATRGGATAWRPGAQLTAFARSMVFPVIAIAALTTRANAPGRWRTAPGAVVVAGGAIAALISIQPFDKYWTLLLPGLIVVACARRPRAVSDRAKLAFLLCVALAPPAVYAATSSADQARVVARYERASADVARMLGPGGTFVRFDSNPFLGTFLPSRDRTPAAVLDFLIAPTSRERLNLEAVDTALSNAAAMIDDGALALAAGNVLPSYRKLREVFVAHLSEFPCVRRTNGLTVRLRLGRCL
jgi:hypothetical protein